MPFELKQGDFPESLRQIHTPPKVLYGEGDQNILFAQKMIAMVGARRCTNYGASIAYDLARELSAHGVIVVSGLAIGIDTKAHEGALAGGGKTIGVLGCGLDFPYLTANRPLRKRMVEQGAVITEYPAMTEASTWNFPQRNRIISGLSMGVVVVEAGLDSGSLITAKWALEQGREVFAVPGPVGHATSEGTNRLIQQGAKLVTKVLDIFDELPLVAGQQKIGYSTKSLTDEEKILSLMVREAKSIDQLVSLSGLPVERLTGLLVTLEIDGKVKGLPGGQFIKKETW